uniref:Uncharacterized protein n=1 Tax=Arundo donax TaxID=35708 RepID=A0A0A8ZKM4_ARUDO
MPIVQRSPSSLRLRLFLSTSAPRGVACSSFSTQRRWIFGRHCNSSNLNPVPLSKTPLRL